MPRLSLPARLAACLLMLAGFLTITAPADAAVPDRKAGDPQRAALVPG